MRPPNVEGRTDLSASVANNSRQFDGHEKRAFFLHKAIVESIENGR